jgi:GT2 family glycosyltransferase
MPSTVTAVVVSYAEPEATRAAVRSLRAQTVPPTEILVVDNHEDALLHGDAGEGAEVVRLAGNVGYTRACNAAAERAQGEWLLFLNPDAHADPDAVARLLEAGADPAVAIVGAQVLLPGGETVNAGANPLHVSGLSWSGRYGEPREDGPPRRVAGVSGAALMARRADYGRLGGMCPDFFLYADDADLCWRARMAGRAVVFCPRAVVTHDYEFDQGNRKWFWLERNRLWSVLSNYSVRSLLLLAPVLLVTEAGTLALAARGGWLGAKVAGWRELIARREELRRWRAGVQAHRTVPDRRLIADCTAVLDTPLVSNPLLPLVNPLMRAYVRVARLVL